MYDFRKWFRKTFRIDSRFNSCPQRAQRRKTRLRLEQLEDRTVPTVVFNPQFGAETVAPPAPGTNYTVLNNPNVQLIFWGQYWADPTGSGPQEVKDITNKVQTLLNSSYLNDLTEYGSDGQATYAGFAVDPSNTIPTGFNAGDPNSSSAIQTEIQKEIDDPTTPIVGPGNSSSVTTSPIYVVISDPNFSGTFGGGYNIVGTYTNSAS